MSIDPEKVLEALSSGKEVTSDDFEFIHRELEETLQNLSDADYDEIYPKLLVISKRLTLKDKELLAKFMYAKDPITAGLALKFVCGSEKEIEERFEEVQNFSLGVSWDFDGDLQVTALEILANYKTPESTSILFSVFEDEESKYNIRLVAYRALLLHADERFGFSPYKRMNFEPGSSDVNWEALEKLR